MIDTIGLVEISSIATAFGVQDIMLKTAPVELLLGRTICAGKYLIVVSGDVASVRASVQAGTAAADGVLIEQGVLSRIHPSVFPAIGQSVQIAPESTPALGVIETFSAASAVGAADRAVKTADVTLLRIHLAMALGGKGLALLCGDIASVEAAVAAGSGLVGEEGMLAGKIVIPQPSPELLREYV